MQTADLESEVIQRGLDLQQLRRQPMRVKLGPIETERSNLTQGVRRAIMAGAIPGGRERSKHAAAE